MRRVRQNNNSFFVVRRCIDAIIFIGGENDMPKIFTDENKDELRLQLLDKGLSDAKEKWSI